MGFLFPWVNPEAFFCLRVSKVAKNNDVEVNALWLPSPVSQSLVARGGIFFVEQCNKKKNMGKCLRRWTVLNVATRPDFTL